MQPVRVMIDPGRVLGHIDPMIFGQYLEHVAPDEHCIYGAVLDEGSSLADERGLRRDVMAAVRDLGVPMIRWPGGCFADVYHWEDGIGPREARPMRHNWHWGGLESNHFGTDEFLTWCEMVDSAPYVNFNLGTGTLDEALRWLDYCNGREPTHDVQLRQRHGRAEPYTVRLWGVGNEQWGAWEAGHMDAATYAERLRNWTQFLKRLDPRASFLGVGSPAADDPDWDRAVLRKAGHLIDYLTLHLYGHAWRDDASEQEYHAVVSTAVFFEERLRQMRAVIEEAQPDRPIPIRISVDEWNIRHLTAHPETGLPVLDRTSPRTLRDALFAAGVLNAMVRQSPAVGMGCYVFLLNGNGVLKVGPDGIVKTPLYYLFQAYRRWLLPVALDAQVQSGEFLTAVRQGRIDTAETRAVPWIDVVATRDADRQRLALALVNRHLTEPAEVELVVEGGTPHGRVERWELTADDVMTANTFGQPDCLRPHLSATDWTSGLTLPPHSVTLVSVAYGL